MITLTDDEQATALRAARYALRGLKHQAEHIVTESEAGRDAAANVAKLERVIVVLERTEQNGVWRCACPQWRQPTQDACEKCQEKKP